MWYVDPKKWQVEVFTGIGLSRIVKEGEKLDGGEVLPGFEVDLKALFAEARRGNSPNT